MEIEFYNILKDFLEENVVIVRPGVKEIKHILDDVRIVGMGAEAIVARAVFLDLDVVIKWRFPKHYMPPHLDVEFRKIRTSIEAKALFKSLAIGVNTPIPLYVDEDKGILIMSFIDGFLLRDVIPYLDNETICSICTTVGTYVAKLHENSIVHGDITTSNVMIDKDKDKIYIIDFGLANFVNRLEDQAIDIHIFFRSVESTHHYVENIVKKCFIEGYKQIRKKYTEKVVGMVNTIRRMGRYVAERKMKSVWIST